MALRFNDAMPLMNVPESIFADVSAAVNAAVVPLPPSAPVLPLPVLSLPPPPVGFVGCFPAPPPPLLVSGVSSSVPPVVASFVRVVPRV